jgi:RimJ/RimL family protein N-acetyltransferase
MNRNHLAKRKTLERMADFMLEGNSFEEAQALAIAKDLSSQEHPYSEKYAISEEEGHLSLINTEGCELACIDFHNDNDMFGEPVIYMNYALSGESGRGNFGALFKRLRRIARESGAKYIELEVDEDNDRAIGIYEHVGFELLGTVPNVSGNFDRFLMRKNMDYD